jgi:hypothetical protein
MGILSGLFGVGYYSMSGSKKANPMPPINAASNDEADFVQYDSPTQRPSRAMDMLTARAGNSWPRQRRATGAARMRNTELD